MTAKTHHFARMRNGQAVSLDLIPQLELEVLQQVILAGVLDRQRVVSMFGTRHSDRATQIYVVLADDDANQLFVGSTVIVGKDFPSLTPRCPQVHLFEREIAEQFDLNPQGHPWLKPVRNPLQNSDFYRVEGDDVHEVSVGPVHAGIIEPGHFRFQCHGETVFHLEIALGYQHRGVEQALVGGPNKRSLHYAETISGDASIAHSTSYCQVVEALGHKAASARAQALRGIALELERLANHIGDLGALAGDVGFLPTASYCGRIRGDFLNMTAVLCGNRFGRNFLVPGGVLFNVEAPQIVDLQHRLDVGEKDVTVAVNLLWDAQSVISRFEDIGCLSRMAAVDLGIVGPAARATGLNRDVRHSHPLGIYRFAHVPMATYDTGDVFARAYVRWLEIQQSIAFIREQVKTLPSGASMIPMGNLSPNMLSMALTEGWRGEVCHVAITDAQGCFSRYKITDPSFHNWPGLAYVLRQQEISDFPICNKSFSLSYCGHDL